ncbi:3127_t:CDS:1 [Paraglomus brasilianum]|uniref:3127_t:CDS:1 n=1 Tax=Paraglomus brasilianum TaxID=144538 RepID=A0A9N8VPW9_9GLOM|nr:3127_t:CDS:1 [Paraglomus brasilianum]
MNMHSDELSSLSNINLTAYQSPMAAFLELSNLTYFEQKLLLNPPYGLFASLESLLDPIRKKHTRKDAPPPRPRNSWLIFRSNFESLLRNSCSNQPLTIQEISKLASKHWKEQSKVVKRYFKALSNLARYIHKGKYPGYTYRPRKSKHNRKKNWEFKKIDKERILRTKFYKNDASGKSNEEQKESYEYLGIEDDGSNENYWNENSNKFTFVCNNNWYDDSHTNSNQTSVDNAAFFNAQSPEEFNLVNDININELSLNHNSVYLSTLCPISQQLSPFYTAGLYPWSS